MNTLSPCNINNLGQLLLATSLMHLTLTRALVDAAASSSPCIFGDSKSCFLPCKCSGGGTCNRDTGECFPRGVCLVEGSAEGAVRGNGKKISQSNDGSAQWKWEGPGKLKKK